MPFDREVFYIEERNLADALDLNPQGLDEIIDFLQASTDESIRLKEWLHFVVQNYVNKQQPIRIFSREGALAIASYLDLRGNATQISLKRVMVMALLDKYTTNKRDAKIRRILYNNSSSLAFRNQRHWLNQADVVRIFMTTSSRLNQAFRDIQRSDSPMRMNIDFENYEGMRFFSLSGLEKISKELSLKLRSEERRAYCNRVSEVAPPVVKFLAIAPSPPDPKQIDQAMNYAKNRDKKTCQVTGASRDKYNPRIEVVGHHLYDKNLYHSLSDDPENILTIDKRLHEDFHQWNGGTQKTCTIDDFIDYVKWRYPEKHELILTLYNKQRGLMLKLPQIQRTFQESRD